MAYTHLLTSPPAPLIILTSSLPLTTRAARARRKTGGSTILGEISALVYDSFAYSLIFVDAYMYVYSWWSERVEASSSGHHKRDGDRSEGPQGRGKGASIKASGGGERSKQEDW